MRITLENLKGDQTLKIVEMQVSVAELVSLLWNIPEKPHSSIFHKDNPDARISIPRAKEKIQAITDKYHDGALDIELEYLKHDKSKRYLGLKLIGHKQNNQVKWHEVVIDQAVFLNHRTEVKDNALLLQMIVKLSRREAAALAKTDLDADSKDAPIPRTTGRRTTTGTIALEPNAPESKPVEQSMFKRILKSPLLHGLLSAIVSGTAMFFAKMTTAVIAGTSIGLGLITWGVESFYYWRKKSIADGHQEFSRMSNKSISLLDDSTKHALNTGLSANSWPAWAKSAFSLDAWKKYRAYGAGLEAGKTADDPLAEKIKQFAKPS